MSSPSSKRRRLARRFTERKVDDVRIDEIAPLLPPACLMEELPITETIADEVSSTRHAIANVLSREDDRLIVVVGPCSIHDTKACKEYALKLRKLKEELSNDLVIVMRIYFEKPRTTVGWKGLINDPELDGSFKINTGLRRARKFLLDVNELGLPAAVEFLDTISPQFIADLVSWGAIGARTTESQCHRELASGLSCPVGFKNGTGGDIKVAADAILSSSRPHSFLSVTKHGLAAIVHTKGNPNCHVILRGGKSGTNYDAKSVANVQAMLAKANIPDAGIMIDCSHGNSKKIHTNQPIVAASVGEQIAAGNSSIVGVMIESHINEGNQKLNPGVTLLRDLKYAVSVTDACINIDTTKEVLRNLAKSVRDRRARVKTNGKA